MPGVLDWLRQKLGGPGDDDSTVAMSPAGTVLPELQRILGGAAQGWRQPEARIPEDASLGQGLAQYLGHAAAGTWDTASNAGQALMGKRDLSPEEAFSAAMLAAAPGRPGGTLGSGVGRGPRSPATSGVLDAFDKVARYPTPYIGKGTDAPLFDLSRIREIPNVPQSTLSRANPPKGIPERYKTVDTPATKERMVSYFNKGLLHDEGLTGLGWYNTMPLLDRFVGKFGLEEGTQKWNRYIDYVAATSPQNPVPQNIRSASYLYGKDLRGEPFPSNIIQNERGQWVWANDAAKPETPYGMLPTSMQNALRVRHEGGMDVLQNPKPPSFAANLKGNYEPLTIDLHNLRALGYTDKLGGKDVLPSGVTTGSYAAGPGYKYLEDLQTPWAHELGVPPAQWQSSVWVGGGRDTGLKSPPEPFLSTFDWNVRRTAKDMGITPEKLLDRFLGGEIAGFK